LEFIAYCIFPNLENKALVVVIESLAGFLIILNKSLEEYFR